MSGRFDPDQIAEISAWLAAAGIDQLELNGPAQHLRILRMADGSFDVRDAMAGDTIDAPVIEVKASSFGKFLDRHPWHEAPLARIGDRVSAGASLGFLQIGLLLREVRAPVAGHVVAIIARAGDLVGFGDIVAEIAPTAGDFAP